MNAMNEIAAPHAVPQFVRLDETLYRLAVAAAADEAAASREEMPPFLVGWAMMEGGQPLAAGGLVKNWPGHATGWWVTTVFARPRHLLQAARFSAGVLEQAQRHLGLRRIEFYCRADAKWRAAFAKALGATEGYGPLEAWGPDGADYWLYARVSHETIPGGE